MSKMLKGAAFRANRRVQGRFAWSAEDHARHNKGLKPLKNSEFSKVANRGGLKD